MSTGHWEKNFSEMWIKASFIQGNTFENVVCEIYDRHFVLASMFLLISPKEGDCHFKYHTSNVMKQLHWYGLLWILSMTVIPLQWRHNEHNNVSNHQAHDCSLNGLFGCRSKVTSKLVTGLCVGNSPGTGEFPAQKASNAKNVSTWWRHHDWIR